MRNRRSKAAATNAKAPKKLKKIDRAFLEKGARTITDKDVEKVVERAEEIKRKFSTAAPLGQFIKDAQLLLSLIRDYWKREYREVPYWALAAAVFALLYVLSPIDLIPDPIPIMGYLDDAAVVSLCLVLIRQELAQYEEWKAAQP